MTQFHLPDVGEGLTEAEIVSWKVAPGDTVTVNQVLVEIETAKSLVELPSPFDGVVGELLVSEGETVEVGTAIISIGADAGGAAVGAGSDPEADLVQDTAASVSHEDGAAAPLVGYGSSGHGTSRRRRGGGSA